MNECPFGTLNALYITYVGILYLVNTLVSTITHISMNKKICICHE